MGVRKNPFFWRVPDSDAVRPMVERWRRAKRRLSRKKCTGESDGDPCQSERQLDS